MATVRLTKLSNGVIEVDDTSLIPNKPYTLQPFYDVKPTSDKVNILDGANGVVDGFGTSRVFEVVSPNGGTVPISNDASGLSTLISELQNNFFFKAPTGGGGGGVNSVTGDGVGGTATDVVMTYPTVDDIAGAGDRIENLYMLGQAQSTIGLFSKAGRANNISSGMKPTVNLNDQFRNGAEAPLSISKTGNITEIGLNIATCAVGTGTVGANVFIQIEAYKVNNTGETLIDTYLVPLDRTKVDVFNNLGGTNLQYASLTVNTAVTKGDMIGFIFKNISANNRINSLSRTVLTAKIS